MLLDAYQYSIPITVFINKPPDPNRISWLTLLLPGGFKMTCGHEKPLKHDKK